MKLEEKRLRDTHCDIHTSLSVSSERKTKEKIKLEMYIQQTGGNRYCTSLHHCTVIP